MLWNLGVSTERERLFTQLTLRACSCKGARCGQLKTLRATKVDFWWSACQSRLSKISNKRARRVVDVTCDVLGKLEESTPTRVWPNSVDIGIKKKRLRYRWFKRALDWIPQNRMRIKFVWKD